MKRRAWIVGVIVLLAAVALIPLWREGIAGSDDILNGIYRLFALDASWQAGVFYPRLAPDLAYAYSAPLFQFYPPLSSYVAELFHLAGLGFIAAIKAGYLLGLMVAGLGMYLYGRTLFGSQPAALLAAVAYVYAPYQLADIYTRGATAEALALALFPWILWAFHGLHAEGSRGRFLLSSLTLAALLLTHNSLALFFLPVLLAYLVALSFGQKAAGRNLLRCLAAVVLALGLSAFFWLPAIAERGYVNIAELTAGFYNPTSHLVPLTALVQRGWLFDYAGPQGFRLGLLPAALALLGLVSAIWQPRPARRLLVFCALVVAVALLLQLPAAAMFWTRVPLVSFIQFPWRLLAFAALAGAVLIGALPDVVARWWRGGSVEDSMPRFFGHRPKQRARVWIVAGLLAALLIVTSTAQLWPGYAAAWQTGHFKESDIGRQDMYDRGRLGFEFFSDYQPTWVKARMADVPLGRPAAVTPAPWQHAPTVEVLRAQAFATALRVETAAAFPLTLHRFYFPGWRAWIDGQPATAYSSGELGLVTVDLPPGSHTVELRFGDTLVRQVAAGVTLVSLLIWLTIASPVVRRRPRLTGLLIALALAGAAAWFVARPASTPARQAAVQANLGDQAQLVGYALDRAVYRPGETVGLTLYWFGLRPADKDTKVFVHLRDLADQQMAGQHDGHPVYGFTPTTRWEPGEFLADAHPIRLDRAVPPGKYQLVVGMYDPDTMQNVAVRQAPQVLPGERIVVAQIEVVAAR